MLACPASLTHRAHSRPAPATDGQSRPVQAKPRSQAGQERTWPDMACRDFRGSSRVVGGDSGDGPSRRGTISGDVPLSAACRVASAKDESQRADQA